MAAFDARKKRILVERLEQLSREFNKAGIEFERQSIPNSKVNAEEYAIIRTIQEIIHRKKIKASNSERMIILQVFLGRRPFEELKKNWKVEKAFHKVSNEIIKEFELKFELRLNNVVLNALAKMLERVIESRPQKPKAAAARASPQQILKRIRDIKKCLELLKQGGEQARLVVHYCRMREYIPRETKPEKAIGVLRQSLALTRAEIVKAGKEALRKPISMAKRRPVGKGSLRRGKR